MDRNEIAPPSAASLATAAHDLALSAGTLSRVLGTVALTPEAAHRVERALCSARQELTVACVNVAGVRA